MSWAEAAAQKMNNIGIAAKAALLKIMISPYD
jgi:hypothetical protein